MDQIVLVIDDDVTSLKRATGIMEKEYRVAAATSGEMAFKYLERNRPSLILLDLNMPDMDGFQVMEKLKADPEYEKIPVIFLAAVQTPENEAQCLEAGAVDFVNKPFIPQVLISRVKRAMELSGYREQLESMVKDQAKQITAQNEQIRDIQDAVIIGMANLIEERDNSTGHHVKNAQAYVKMLSDAVYERGLYPNIMTEKYRDDLIKASPLHDVGNMARDVALSHHERWDGNGYPEGLAGEEIPLGARIMAIADVFDALSADRVYHRGIKSIDKVLSILEDSSGTQFDPALVEVFVSLKDKISEYIENEENV